MLPLCWRKGWIAGVFAWYCVLLYAGVFNAGGWGWQAGARETVQTTQENPSIMRTNDTTSFGPPCWSSADKLANAGLKLAFPAIASGIQCTSVLPPDLCGPAYIWLTQSNSAELSHNLHSCHSMNGAAGEQCCCISARQGSNSGAKFRCLPSVLIPGAPKAGTTVLWSGLMQHPASLSTKHNVKELGFFLKGANGGSGVRNLEIYLNMLAECPSHAPAPGHTTAWVRECIKWAANHFSVDGSALYTTNMGALKRGSVFLPTAKVLFLRRNPVDRAASSILQTCRTWARMNSNASIFAATEWVAKHVIPAIEKDAVSLASCTQSLCEGAEEGAGLFSQVLTSSCYGPQVHALQELFQNVLVLDFEDFTTQLDSMLPRVYAHLGLPTGTELDVAALAKLPADMGLDWTSPSAHVCLGVQQNITDFVHQYDHLLDQCA